MSKTELDGSDPRVLAPSDDEQSVIVKAAFGGAGDAYHTEECMSVRSMRNTKEVKLSVAEWKGYHECHFCKEDRTSTDREKQQSTGEQETNRPTVDECEGFRTKIGVEGVSVAQLATETDWGRTSVYRHATGSCQHETSVAPVSHGWYFDPEQSDTPGVRNETNDNISEHDCQELRLRLVKGKSARTVAKEFDLSNDGVRYHALGRCAHDTDCDAVSHGWHKE